MSTYIRAGQWTVMLSTAERWGRFCHAASLYEAELARKRSIVVDSLGRMSDVEAVKRRLRRRCASQGAAMDALPHAQAQLGSSPPAIAGDSSAAEQQKASQDHALGVSTTPSEWGNRYFEKQEAGGRCGRHALNNLLGVQQYDDTLMEQACQVVVEDTEEHRRHHCHGNGWFSHSVLAQALDLTVVPVWRMIMRPATPAAWGIVAHRPEVAGVVCNEGNAHWTCIVSEGANVFYVDSLRIPVLITEERFGQIVGQHPMSFLVVRHDLDISPSGEVVHLPAVEPDN